MSLYKYLQRRLVPKHPQLLLYCDRPVESSPGMNSYWCQ